jgi:outer membrane lipoprotein SlyB
MATQRFSGALCVACALVLGACADMPGMMGGSPSASSSPASYSGSGVVESVELVKGNDPGLVGALIGAVAGGVLGNQLGAGRGRTVATIAGTVGGAVAGREVERRVSTKDQVHKITVRMNNGARQTIAMEHDADFRVGDRVHIENGQIYRDR